MARYIAAALMFGLFIFGFISFILFILPYLPDRF